MKRIEQNHWYIHDNKMSIGLTHNHVSIDIKTDGEFVVYTLEVIDEKRALIEFNNGDLVTKALDVFGKDIVEIE